MHLGHLPRVGFPGGYGFPPCPPLGSFSRGAVLFTWYPCFMNTHSLQGRNFGFGFWVYQDHSDSPRLQSHGNSIKYFLEAVRLLFLVSNCCLLVRVEKDAWTLSSHRFTSHTSIGAYLPDTRRFAALASQYVCHRDYFDYLAVVEESAQSIEINNPRDTWPSPSAKTLRDCHSVIMSPDQLHPVDCHDAPKLLICLRVNKML